MRPEEHRGETMKKRLAFVIGLLLLVALTPGCSSIYNRAPIAYIDAMKPPEASVGESVWFKGHGEDPDGRITSYQWRSSIDGQLDSEAEFETAELSPGTHTIYFRVRDDQGTWSDEDITTVKVVPAATSGTKIAIGTFQVSPTSIASGETATLQWSVSGASRVLIEPGIGNVSLTGSRVVSPTADTTYMLTAISGEDSTWASAQLRVAGQPNLPMVQKFAVNPTTIRRGETATLEWSVSGSDSVTITSPSSIVNVLSTGKAVVVPTQTSVYQLTASNKAGAVVRMLTVTVKAASPQDTVILLSLPSEGGYVDENGRVGSVPQVGDDDSNNARQGFLSFDITGIPEGSDIVAVALDIGTGQRIGLPFTDLGDLRIYAQQYGKLGASDFVTSVPSMTLFKYASRPVGSFTSSALQTAVQNAVDDGERRFQVRLQFTEWSDGNYETDLYRLDSGLAVLVVTYQ
jgi:hypothetical protein